MKTQRRLMIGALCLGLGGSVSAGPSTTPPAVGDPGRADATMGPLDPLSHGWRAQAEDNICGISNLNKVSNPAVVDYDALLAATPQMKRAKKEKIDPDSPEGKLLRQEAGSLITRKAEVVRAQRGHCGVWKAIRHEDGRAIPDITAEVLAAIRSET
ncbi:MAG: hypothetical protein AB1726_04960 [Planctomycetota bacterium]